MDTDPRVVRIVTELRAEELARALNHALAGAPHWRQEAQTLLQLIDYGVLPDALDR
jgi:hypothetical protein